MRWHTSPLPLSCRLLPAALPSTPPNAPPCRQDHSFLLQAFRFFVRNNFLLDYAQGVPLQLPAPPAYPAPPPAPQWGRLPGEPAAGEQQQPKQPGDVRALLAAAAKEAIDVELSDEEGEEAGLLLPSSAAVHQGGCKDADTSSGSSEEAGDSSSEAESSGSEAESDEDGGVEPEAEVGQLRELAAQELAGHPGVEPLASGANGTAVPPGEGEDEEDELEYS